MEILQVFVTMFSQSSVADLLYEGKGYIEYDYQIVIKFFRQGEDF